VLQHYAALGRDVVGAESVNLTPVDAPKDVYSDVLALVGVFVFVLCILLPLQGIVFDGFLLFLCQRDYEKMAGPICMKFSGKVWSDHGRPDSILGQFRETVRC